MRRLTGIQTREVALPFSPATAGATELGVCLLEFGSPERTARELADLGRLFAGAAENDSTAPPPPASPTPGDAERWLDQLESELAAYFAGDLREFTVPLHTPGTPWQQRVWDALLDIPFGETTSYGSLAAKLGNPGGARAVGAANGQNRVAILIPCHRVIEAGGGLRGYAGGLDNKRRLLDHEASVVGSVTLFG